MKYWKIKADKIFDGYKYLTDHVLVLREDGTVEELLPSSDAGSDFELVQGIITPGFINCHCHLELSHMRGLIPELTGLVDFVFKVVTERHFSDEEILDAIWTAEDEMLQNGIVAAGDICNNTLTIPQKQKGRIAYYNFIEASGWLPSVASLRFERAKKIYEEYESASRLTLQAARKIPNSIVPHASYSVSQQLWEQIQPYFENKVVSIHNQETAFEDEFFLQGTGDFQRMYQLMKIDNSHHQPSKRSSLQSYFDKLEKAANAILVHNTFIGQEDIDYVMKASRFSRHAARNESWRHRDQPQTPNHKPQTFFCLCPNANQYIENVLPPVELFRKNNCNIVLGTDSLASNWRLNIMDEIKTLRKNFPAISLEEMLQWATSNGARALQMDDVFGSFEKGKKPGVNVVDVNTLEVKKIC